MSATASSPPVQEEVQDTGATSPNAQIPPTTSPPQLELSLDDLSQDDKRNDEDETNDASEQKESCEEKESLQRKQEQAACGSADRDAKYMETRLQRNLKQQQAHYARQRRLFEDLRAGRTSTQSECSPDSDSSNASRSSRELSSSPGEGHERLARYCTLPPRKHPMAAMCRLQTVGITNNGSRAHQMVSPTRYRSLSPENDQNDDDDDDSNAQAMLRRIKDKARSEFHRHRLPSEGSPIAVSSSTSHSDRMVKAPAEFLVEMQQQEVSNDALRRQLDLLRRLQLENNRFRQESRTLRERNEILRERDQVREREMKRLRDEATELDARVQRDQTSLASAAQLTHKLKVVQKRLAVAQSENHDLQTALQEARDAFDQLQAESQAKTSDLEMEVKRWKRNTKQLRQEENRTGEEVETYKKTIAALEEDAAKRRSRLKDAKREIIDAKHNIAELSTLIEEKTAHCESIENSAAACVERMSVGMEELQKSLAQECEKHKKAEVTCSTQQMQLERQQAENAMLLDRQKELERQLTLFQEKWKERKQVHHEQLRRQTTQIEEYATRHKKDASTIGQIRKEHEALEAQLAEVKSTASKLKTEVADEARAVQAQVEILRKYVQNASQEQSSSTNTVEDTLLPFESQADSGRSQHEGIWREIPELQVIQGAMSALRNEMMNIVNETQRSRHLMRQQGRKLALALERTEELEHLHAEDAAKIKELREQRMLVEQAREIVSQEKIEVLKWSEQTCAKNESLEAELKKCSQLVFHSQKLLLQALKSDSSWSERDESKAGKTESLRRSFSALEKNVNSLVSQRDHWRLESEKRTREVQEAQTQLSALGRELDAKDNEFKKTLKEIESLHTKHAEEQKLHFEQCIADMDKERTTLTNKLKEESARVAEVEEASSNLQQQLDGFEQDLPVFATVLHLFVLVVQPLILQVSDLLAQKRLLLRENAEFVRAHEQVECIGQVLKEMIPAGAPNMEKIREQHRRLCFRRVVIAIFALNRFQHFGSSSGNANEQSGYGLCAPLKVIKSRKRTHSLSLHSTVIKVLSPKFTLSRLSLRPILERLKKLEVTDRVAKVVDSCSEPSRLAPSTLGNLILKVVVAIDPASKYTLAANTNGAFHCEALLERRRRHKNKRDEVAECDNGLPSKEEIPTVALIRKRILALGKRVEDLHFQRNSLQKENYEFQFQLEQQATTLSEMAALQKKLASLQEELAALHNENDQKLQRKQVEHEAKNQEVLAKEKELLDAQKKVEILETEVSSLHDEISRTESERVTLQLEVEKLKSLSVEEEEKADTSKAAARRQEEEVKSLKQAVKKAHELYQKVSCQLEKEVQDKAALKTVVEHLKHQHDKVERELREEKLKELEKSFYDGSDSDSGASSDSMLSSRHTRVNPSLSRSHDCCNRKATLASTMKAKKKTSFAPSLATDAPNQFCTDNYRRRGREERTRGRGESRSDSVSPVREHTSTTWRSDGAGAFLNEWKRLDGSRALTDMPSPLKDDSMSDNPNNSNLSSAVLRPISPAHYSDSPYRQTQAQKSRRRVEIDKVNAAVHDYMDRIDDKLSKMYGIPPSCAIQRPSIQTPRCTSNDDGNNSGDVDCSDASSNCSSNKADETRVE